MTVRSVNLTKRNEKVCNIFFKATGRNGRFSSWVNTMMDREFILDPEEAIRQELRKNTATVEKINDQTETLLKKLRVIIDKKEQKD